MRAVYAQLLSMFGMKVIKLFEKQQEFLIFVFQMSIAWSHGTHINSIIPLTENMGALPSVY